MSIGQRIKKRRTELNMTQDELAILVGYKTRSAINKIELDERDVKHSQIVLFAKALKTTPHYLIGWLDDPLSEAEKKLLNDFRLLNDEGQAAALGAIKGFTMLDLYKKADNVSKVS